MKPRIVYGGSGTWWLHLPGQGWTPAASWREALDAALEWWSSGEVKP